MVRRGGAEKLPLQSPYPVLHRHRVGAQITKLRLDRCEPGVNPCELGVDVARNLGHGERSAAQALHRLAFAFRENFHRCLVSELTSPSHCPSNHAAKPGA